MFSPRWTISHSVHMLFVDTWVYFNSTNLDVFVLPASTTTDTDSILPCCLAPPPPTPKCWTLSLFSQIDRAHKNIAKCYNTGTGVTVNPAFSIAFALDSSQVSFALNVCRNELQSRCHVFGARLASVWWKCFIGSWGLEVALKKASEPVGLVYSKQLVYILICRTFIFFTIWNI